MGTDNWKSILEIISAAAAIATALSAIATFITVFIARKQLQAAIDQKEISIEQTKISIEQSRTQFEDSLAKEYRDLIQKLPLKILLNQKISDEEYEEAKPILFHYINLTNDQIFLRSKNRISLEVWNDWKGGIKYNLDLPAFRKFWEEIKPKIKSFKELRNFENPEFDGDPKNWNDEKAKSLKS